MTLILRQTLETAVDSPFEWDGGAKQVFDWKVEPRHTYNGKVRVGCFSANHWFMVAWGRSDRETLSYAKRHLKAITTRPTQSFEYIEEE